MFFKANRFHLWFFYLIINNFIQHAKEEKSTNFRYRTFKGFFPRNWIHSVAVTSLEGENQILFKSVQQMVYVDDPKLQLKIVCFLCLVSIKEVLL